MGKVYVIEHMEPEEETSDDIKVLPEWIFLEYFHILQKVVLLSKTNPRPIPDQERQQELSSMEGQSSKAIFSHLSLKSSKALVNRINRSSSELGYQDQKEDPIARSIQTKEEGIINSVKFDPCTCTGLSVIELMSSLQIPVNQVCLLDPKAEKQLEPEDSENFKWFLFGGILGDDPPRDRTSQLRVLGFPTRNLGSVQMTTDTAVIVTKMIVEDGTRFDEIGWLDRPELRFNSKESVEMPFRYISDDQKPVMPDGMRELIRKDLNRSFEF